MNEQSELYELAVDFLKNNRKRFDEIHEATGLGVHWMDSVAQRKRKDPGVKRIEALLKYAGLYPGQDATTDQAA